MRLPLCIGTNDGLIKRVNSKPLMPLGKLVRHETIGMEKVEDLKHILKKYLVRNINEVERQLPFQIYLEKSKSADLFRRDNFEGHITASAIIIDIKKNEMLLIKHKALNRWLQPGGHVDDTDKSILDASLREIEEEVNIKKEDLKLVLSGSDKVSLFDIDSHLIPDNVRKKEPQHYHHDLRFLFSYSGRKIININKEEALDYNWLPFDNLENNETFHRVIIKIRAIGDSGFNTRVLA